MQFNMEKRHFSIFDFILQEILSIFRSSGEARMGCEGGPPRRK
jgi:hypothetical protein